MNSNVENTKSSSHMNVVTSVEQLSPLSVCQNLDSIADKRTCDTDEAGSKVAGAHRSDVNNVGNRRTVSHNAQLA